MRAPLALVKIQPHIRMQTRLAMFDGSANGHRLNLGANVPPPLTVALIVVNRGEPMIELLTAAASLLASMSDDEDEAADHNCGGKRADDEDGGENRVESMDKLLVLHVAEIAILVLRPRSFALRCWPLGGRRCRRCRRRRRSCRFCCRCWRRPHAFIRQMHIHFFMQIFGTELMTL